MSGAHILIVEDDEVLRDLIARNLSARNHEVHLATDAQSALRQLRAGMFDLIFLDINLPDLTGWDVLRVALHEQALQPIAIPGYGDRLPVVVLSAVRVSPHRLNEFRPLACISKPFPMESLLRLAQEAAARRPDWLSSESSLVLDPGNP